MVEQINQLAQWWWQWSLAMFWQVGLLIALLALVDRLIRRWAWPQVRYALWSLVLVKLLLSPGLSLPSALVPKLRPLAEQVWAQASKEPEVAWVTPSVHPFFHTRLTPGIAQPQPHLLLAVEAGPMAVDSVDGPGAVQAARPRLVWQSYAMAVWLLGLVTLATWLTVKLRRLSREYPDSPGKEPLPQSFYDQLDRCAERLGLRRKPTPVVTNRIQTPAVFGLFRPVLLMPVGYIRRLSREETEHLLLHELAHIKRGDLLVHSLYMGLQLVYWYNPLLWLTRRRLRHLRELCCDATVAGLLRNRTVAYRRTLLEAARQFLVTPVEYGLGLVGLFEDSNCLISRINCLEKPIWRYQKMKKIVAISLALILLACVLPMAQARQDAVPESSNTSPVLAETKPAEVSDTSQPQQAQSQQLEQLLKSMQALQEQLQQLELQKQQLEQQASAISHAEHQAHQAAEHVEHLVQQAGEHAEHAKLKAKEAKDKAAKVKSKVHAEHWEQWAQHMQEWAQQHEKWAQSDEFKQWQKDMQQWAKGLAQMQLTIRGTGSASPTPVPVPQPMPVMPPMPVHAMIPPVAPVLPEMVPPQIPLLGDVPIVSTPDATTEAAPIWPGEAASAGRSADDVTVKKDEDGRFSATREMQFVSKAKPGTPFVIRNNQGRIVLRPSQDGRCDVRVVIRGKAATDAEARAKVEQVGMNVESSDKRYFVRPVTANGGNWENLNVDLFVTVPPGIEPDVEAKMGRVDLHDFTGKIKVVTHMGAIKAVNSTGDLDLLTKMGAIEFVASKDLSAQLNVLTKMGSIKSDLPLKIDQSDMFRKSGKGTMGSGQGNINLTTEMGSISLKWYSPAEDGPDSIL